MATIRATDGRDYKWTPSSDYTFEDLLADATHPAAFVEVYGANGGFHQQRVNLLINQIVWFKE